MTFEDKLEFEHAYTVGNWLYCKLWIAGILFMVFNTPFTMEFSETESGRITSISIGRRN